MRSRWTTVIESCQPLSLPGGPFDGKGPALSLPWNVTPEAAG